MMSLMPHNLPSRHRQRGATLVEWLIVAPPMLFIILAIIQVGFIMMAKTSVNYAVFEAARAGSVNHADINTIDTAFANALVPFYGGGKTAPALAVSLANATADLALSGTAITILNPTQESFMDFGVVENGITQIPNDNLRYRATTPGANSGQSIQDANLLKVEVVYGYHLAIPLVNSTITAMAAVLDPAHALYYSNGRIPILAQATVRMQSAAYNQAGYVASPGPGNNGVSPPVPAPAPPPAPGTTPSPTPEPPPIVDPTNTPGAPPPCTG